MSDHPTYSAYGAYKLKASYQKNMLIGNLSVFSAVLLVLSICWIISYFAEPPVLIEPIKRTYTVKSLPNILNPQNPNTMRKKSSRPNQPQSRYAPMVPIEDSDDIPFEEPLLVSVTSFASDSGIDDQSLSDGFQGNEAFGDGTIDVDVYPGENEFVPFEKAPVMIYNKQPEFPKLCLLAGIEGDVIVKVLVGTDGLVKKALIAKSSGNESFDKAALDAAQYNQFTPAVQNSYPISIWVSYTVTFRLK